MSLKKHGFAGALLLVFFLAVPSSLFAQQGPALKLGALFNQTRVEDERQDLRPSDATGWSVGAEYVLPLGLGVGLSAFTAGSPDEFSLAEGSLVVLGEANYFIRLPLLPLSPYAGFHVGLGTYALEDVENRPRSEVDFGDLGYQLGVRFQPTSLLGLDAQYRRVSGHVAHEQGVELESGQWILGVTLF